MCALCTNNRQKGGNGKDVCSSHGNCSDGRALTEAEDSNVTMDTISTVLPIGLALAGLQAVATGSCSFVGSAGVEAELLDSQTNTRLMAAVDRQEGGKVTGQGDKFDERRTVKNAIDFWAQRLQTRLTELRAK